MRGALIACALVAIGTSESLAAEPDPEATVRAADLALRCVMQDPDTAIPQSVLADAHGLLILPALKLVNVVAGGGQANGVLLTRTAGGGWSTPKFVRFRTGSIGAQAGYTTSDEILVFMTRNRLETFQQRGDLRIAFGAYARLGGSFGRKLRAISNANPNRVEQYYAAGKGLSGGFSLRGESLKLDPRAEAAYYEATGAVPESASLLLANLQSYSAKIDAALPPLGVPLTRLPPVSTPQR
ncbi:MAG: lipid-binding SYLF domain-containing protein [Pirellulales bacterium]